MASSADVDAVFTRHAEPGSSHMRSLKLGSALRDLHLAPSIAQLKGWADSFAESGDVDASPTERDHLHNNTIISREAFRTIAQQAYVPLLAQREDFVSCLRMFDRFGDGRIDADELRRALQFEGEAMSEDEVNAAFKMLLPATESRALGSGADGGGGGGGSGHGAGASRSLSLRPDLVTGLLFPSLGTTTTLGISGVGGAATAAGWEQQLRDTVLTRDTAAARRYLSSLTPRQLHDTLLWISFHAGDPELPDLAPYAAHCHALLSSNDDESGSTEGGGSTGAAGAGTGAGALMRPPAHVSPSGFGQVTQFGDGDAAASKGAAGLIDAAEERALNVLQRVCRRHIARKRTGAAAMFAVAKEVAEQMRRFSLMMKNGLEVLKFPRQGKPAKRVLWLHTDGALYLTDEKSMSGIRAGTNSSDKRIPLNDLTAVMQGANASVFKLSSQYSKHVKGQEEACMSVMGKPEQPQFHFRVASTRGCVLLVAKLRSLMTQLAGPKAKPWGPKARREAVRYFSRKGYLPPNHVLAAVKEDPELTEAQLAALPAVEREAYQVRRVSNAVGTS